MKKLIGYTTLGTNDFERAVTFYDQLLEVIGAKRAWSTERFAAWITEPDLPAFSVCKPYDENQATAGNGVMIALSVESTEQVDALYNKALELGASCDGPPGQRSKRFYAGYFRDLDGNKLNAYFMG